VAALGEKRGLHPRPVQGEDRRQSLPVAAAVALANGRGEPDSGSPLVCWFVPCFVSGILPHARRGEGDLSQAWHVARAIETSRRREDLTFNHHAEVAALPPDEADALLDWCEETPKPRTTQDVMERVGL
jgi:hypothetical protein